jgi:hypothetical protein
VRERQRDQLGADQHEQRRLDLVRRRDAVRQQRHHRELVGVAHDRQVEPALDRVLAARRDDLGDLVVDLAAKRAVVARQLDVELRRGAPAARKRLGHAAQADADRGVERLERGAVARRRVLDRSAHDVARVVVAAAERQHLGELEVRGEPRGVVSARVAQRARRAQHGGGDVERACAPGSPRRGHRELDQRRALGLVMDQRDRAAQVRDDIEQPELALGGAR